MKVARSTLLSAFAQMLGNRIAPQLLLSHSELADDWVVTGLRREDLHELLEHLYAMDYVDRTEVDGEVWYRLTAIGCIELRICRESFWARLRDRWTLTRLRTRLHIRRGGGDHVSARSARRRDDFPATEPC
ncbi:MAG: hypothetical protein PHP86_02770 [Nevskiales bacterium]|nr:hypothetical protein [Nevskiales bacterium]